MTHSEPDLFAEERFAGPCLLTVTWHQYRETGEHHPRQQHENSCHVQQRILCTI